MTYISWYSDFALYLEDYFDVQKRYLRIMSQFYLMLDFKIKLGHCDLYFMV